MVTLLIFNMITYILVLVMTFLIAWDISFISIPRVVWLLTASIGIFTTLYILTIPFKKESISSKDLENNS